MKVSKNEAEIRVRVRRKPRGILQKILLATIGIYIFFLAYEFVSDMVIARLAGVEQIRQGVIQTSVKASGVIVRNERVVPAPRTGRLKVLVPEGQRVRVGETVAKVVVPSLDSKTGETLFNITAPQAGIVSYYLDGLEELYSPKNLKELDLNKVETIKSEPRQVLPGSEVEEGRPVLKIINNLEPIHIIAEIADGQKLSEKSEKKAFLLSFGSAEGKTSAAHLLARNFRGKANQILLRLADYNESLATPRRFDFDLITERFAGYVVPAKAIVRKEGKDGIYIVYKERVRWKKVDISGMAEEKVVISGVTPDIKVILNPEYVKEGYPIKIP